MSKNPTKNIWRKRSQGTGVFAKIKRKGNAFKRVKKEN